ncbi:MAG: LeuA family protein [Patescibacteria group bacterium]|nr:LeuA family protein [Patescibacteria group bacterium]
MVTANVYKPRSLEIIDTTLRDGLQSPLWNDFEKFYPNLEEKLAIFEALVRYGVRFIEVFSPVVSQREGEDLAAMIAKRDELRQELKTEIFILVHVRCHPKDVEAALKYPVDTANFYFGISPEAREFNHGKALKEMIAVALPLIKAVRQSNPNLFLRFSGEDAFRTKEKDLFKVYDQLAPWVDRFGIPDTVGIATPETVAKRVKLLQKRYPKVALEGHFHNDRGLALINTLTAIKSGMTYINTSILGLAERSGITSLTALLFNLYLDHPELAPYENGTGLEGFDLFSSYSLNVLMASMMKMQVPAIEPVSLTNRTHAAGVHTNAVLKNPSVYEGYHLENFGVTERRLLLGPLSGKHVIQYYLTEVLNYSAVSEEMAENITKKFKMAATNLKGKEAPTLLLEKIARKSGLQKRDKLQNQVEDLR